MNINIFGSNTNNIVEDLDMKNNAIKNVKNPVNNQEVATKHYVDLNKVLPPKTQFTLLSATNNEGGYAWVDFMSIPPRLTEEHFNTLPAGLYACYTAYLPPSRVGILPIIKGYLTCYAYQNGGHSVYNKRYTWCSNASNTSIIYVSSITENVWNTWVMQTPLLTSGANAMNENINMGSHRIVNLAAPLDAADAVTKAYVDTKYNELMQRLA